jgi:hypothetical protein
MSDQACRDGKTLSRKHSRSKRLIFRTDKKALSFMGETSFTLLEELYHSPTSRCGILCHAAPGVSRQSSFLMILKHYEQA